MSFTHFHHFFHYVSLIKFDIVDAIITKKIYEIRLHVCTVTKLDSSGTAPADMAELGILMPGASSRRYAESGVTLAWS